MFIYLFMFAWPALLALSPYNSSKSLARQAWWAVGIVFTLLIGFRYQIGVDWEAYLTMYYAALDQPFSQAIVTTDPGYAFLNWVSGLFGGQIYLVNLICGAVIMTGIISFSRRQPNPWLAFVVSVPYMIIAVSMGYSRQGVSLGFELLALVAIVDGRLWRFFLFVLIGALFHKTAVILLPFGFISIANHNRLWERLLVAGIGIWVGLMLVTEYYDSMMLSYVEAQMQSSGAQVRVVMNALPAVLLLLFRKKLMPDDQDERRFWILLSFIAIASVPLVGFASTAVDRIALYFMPLQLYVFARLHRLFDNRLLKSFVVLGVVIVYGLVLWTWLTYGNYTHAWVPYKLWPFI